VAGVIALPDDGRGALDVQFRGQGALGSDRVLRDADPVPAGVPLDLVGLERVEFLRGPGSAFEGATGLGGGTVATVGKRPRLEPGSELRIAADSWGRIRSVADHSASLGTRRSTYRVSAGHERTADHRDGRPDGQGLTLAPVFAIPVGERAHLQIQGDYLRRTFTRDPGLPLAKASLGVPAERFLGESQDEVTAESGIAQLELMLYPEGDLQLRQALSYQGALTRGRVVELTGLTGAGQVTRRSRESNQRVHAFRSQSELHRQLHMGRVEHALIAGLEFTNGLSAGESSVDSLASTALAAPRQGSSAVAVGARQGFRAPARGVALYAQDLLRLHARWRLLVSGRWQHHALERSSGSDAGALAAPVSNEDSRTVSGATGRAGLVFQPTQRGRVFVLAGHSFDPSWSHAERGDVPGLLRTRATQYEIGWKQESANGRLDWSTSAYALRQRDVRALRPFLAAGPYSWRIGEQTTTGLEFDAAGSLGNDLRVTFGYAYQHARVTDPGEAGIADGTRLPMAPRHHATLWAVYRVPSGTFAGLDLGAGLVAQSERTSALVGGPVLEGFQEYDAMVGYGRRRWQAQLQVRNLTDTQAFDAVPGDHLVARDPRSVRGSMLVRF
jgi:iron complex outermembrane receptor protein